MLDHQSKMRSILDLLEAVDQDASVKVKQLNENVGQGVAEGIDSAEGTVREINGLRFVFPENGKFGYSTDGGNNKFTILDDDTGEVRDIPFDKLSDNPLQADLEHLADEYDEERYTSGESVPAWLKKKSDVAEEGPKNALGKALYRDLSKEKKASPAQVQRNKERWAKRQAERGQGVAEADELQGRWGTNAINRHPRAGQTNLRNIPLGNLPDHPRRFSDQDRQEQPERLKQVIKKSLGKHSTPNLPEGSNDSGAEGGSSTSKDLTKVSTKSLQAYVDKHSGGGVPAFGKGAQLKRVQAELKRRTQDVAEGEKTMSRAAKGYEKYGKKGMMALAKAGRDDAGDEKLDSIRNKYDRYDNDTKKDVAEESINEDTAGTVQVYFINSGHGQDLGAKPAQNLGISLDGAGRPVMKIANPFASGETLIANFDPKSGGWIADLD